MAVCQDTELYCSLFMDLAFVESQIQDDMSMAYHCVRQSLSIQERKEMYENLFVLFYL